MRTREAVNSTASFLFPGSTAVGSQELEREARLKAVCKMAVPHEAIRGCHDCCRAFFRRQQGLGSHGYNYGLRIPKSEIRLRPIPERVEYDPKTMRAKLTFRISQNRNGDGTVDPSHIAFKFSGKDEKGNAMNVRADEFSGFSKIQFCGKPKRPAPGTPGAGPLCMGALNWRSCIGWVASPG